VSHGLVLGKFLPYHAGHAHLIRSARARVDALTVLICSIARESIPGGARYQWVRSSHPDCRVIHVSEEVPQAPEDDPAFWPIWTDLIRCYAGGDVDIVFTSESYGDELAARIGARHVCVDAARRTVPVSGTAIRNDPMGHWQYIPEVVRPYFVRRVAILGAESVGKTTLARQLAERFDTTWVSEYGRAYCEGLDASRLELPDFEAIAWGQATWEDAAAATANRVLICDTDLHTTCTWSDLIAGARPAWLTGAACARRYDLVLLLDEDVPWIDDGTRVLDARRAEHTSRLRAELEAAGRDFLLVSGDFPQRLRLAVDAVERLITTCRSGTAHSIAF
jgi:HTH-type transcriptional regulator, transcriptional repressor of NAD biosynthesis genes